MRGTLKSHFLPSLPSVESIHLINIFLLPSATSLKSALRWILHLSILIVLLVPVCVILIVLDLEEGRWWRHHILSHHWVLLVEVMLAFRWIHSLVWHKAHLYLAIRSVWSFNVG